MARNSRPAYLRYGSAVVAVAAAVMAVLFIRNAFTLNPTPLSEQVISPTIGAATEVIGDELPPTDLLTEVPERYGDTGKPALDAMGTKLMEALRTFRIEGQLAGRTTGPVVTQFEVEPAPGVERAPVDIVGLVPATEQRLAGVHRPVLEEQGAADRVEAIDASTDALARVSHRFPVLGNGQIARGYAGCFDDGWEAWRQATLARHSSNMPRREVAPAVSSVRSSGPSTWKPRSSWNESRGSSACPSFTRPRYSAGESSLATAA